MYIGLEVCSLKDNVKIIYDGNSRKKCLKALYKRYRKYVPQAEERVLQKEEFMRLKTGSSATIELEGAHIFWQILKLD